MKRKNTGIADGLWSLPMGHIEENESPAQALIRECKEELAVNSIKPDFLLSITDETAAIQNYLFKVNSWCGPTINNEPERCEKIGWFKCSDLPANINPVSNNIIEMIDS